MDTNMEMRMDMNVEKSKSRVIYYQKKDKTNMEISGSGQVNGLK